MICSFSVGVCRIMAILCVNNLVLNCRMKLASFYNIHLEWCFLKSCSLHSIFVLQTNRETKIEFGISFYRFPVAIEERGKIKMPVFQNQV